MGAVLGGDSEHAVLTGAAAGGPARSASPPHHDRCGGLAVSVAATPVPAAASGGTWSGVVLTRS